MSLRRFAPTLLLPLLLVAACAPAPEETSARGDRPAAPAPGTDEVTTAPKAAPLPDANRIAWSTASEVDNFGYDIYRSDSADGPFERITEQPLEGAGTTDEPSSYEFIDDDIELGREYFYYIESISMSGERRRFTGVRRAPPK